MAPSPSSTDLARSAPTAAPDGAFDYDFIIVGSGFGGSVSALRLAEKGYKVAVIEQGRRFRTDEFPKTNWNLKRFLWMPKLGFHGFMAITMFKDVVIFHGAGVGGGSLVYANTHLEPLDGFFTDPQWAHLADWRRELEPHYRTARRMLGSVESPAVFESDKALKACFDDLGTGDTFKKHTVGVYFGEPGQAVPDPYFGGEGPERTGCNYCGGCMIGCRVGAKNTLDKNYLHLAERLGADVIPLTRVRDVKPLDGARGTTGWQVDVESTRGLLFKSKRTLRARQVIMAGGVLGTLGVLHEAKTRGSLPALSKRLGHIVRTNSESIQGVMLKGKDISKGIAISSGGMLPDGTHVEIFRYGDRADAMSALTTVHVGGGRLPRQLYFLAAAAKRPLHTLKRLFWPVGWSRGLAGVLAMQALDNSMQLHYRRRWWAPWKRSLSSDWGDQKPPPTFMPGVHDLTRRLADKLGGEPGSVLPEVLLNTTTTAHILGGCPMGDSPETGVIDRQNRVFNYDGLYVVDGSMISANLGVNPSLTITAMAERAMSLIPPKG
ncbi:MAG: GMC family oxidoreductase [Myxococcales bacterium]|nr:GMC family oxidoreductase [Myxococcales bacterium]